MAVNAYRNYNNNTSALSKNLEKLSSGYKINRAGDAAAGLEIDKDTDVKLEYKADGTDGTLKLTVGEKIYTWKADDSVANLTGSGDKEVELKTADGKEKIKVTLAKDQAVVGNDKVTDATDSKAEKTSCLPLTTTAKTAGCISLQTGDDAADYNKLQVQIGSMKTAAFMGQTFKMTTDSKTGVTSYTATGGTTISEISIATDKEATAAIDTIKQAINYVSSVRGDLGALQNRLDHTANNLSVMTENIQDAESTIRDTDVAEEMMAYTKNNILIQSAQAMLAQVNAVPQGVLQLLG